MDAERFDRFVRGLSLASRRRLLGRVIAALEGLAGPATGGEAARKPKRRRRGSEARKGRGRNDNPRRGAAGQNGGLAAEARRKKKKKNKKGRPATVAGGGPRKVLVFLSGICSASGDDLFDGLRRKLTRDYGYRDGEDFLSFSYVGGEATCRGWTQFSYEPSAPAAFRIVDSVTRLHLMLASYLDLHPEARFVLVGHSLGGVVAFDEIANARRMESDTDDVLDHLEAVITIDSPLHGAALAQLEVLVPNWASCLAGGQAIEDLADRDRDTFATEQEIVRTAAVAADKGIALVTMGNRLDCVFDAKDVCDLPVHTGKIETQWVRFPPAIAVERSYKAGFSSCLIPPGGCIDARHKAFLQVAEGIALVAVQVGKQLAGATRTNTPCGDDCVDAETDPENCAACGRRCPEGAVCVGGGCRCPAGRTLCAAADACVDTTTEREHCGGCGRYCAPPGTCKAGKCLRPQGSGYEHVATWGSLGDADGQFKGPAGIAVDEAGTVYVVDGINHRIQTFSADGAFLGKWDSLGEGESDYWGPEAVAVDGAGNVYVTFLHGGAHAFTADWVRLATFGPSADGDGVLLLPRGVAVDAAGNVYVSDWDRHLVTKFASNGAFVTAWGSHGQLSGQFVRPYGVAVDAVGNVYVADSENHRVQKFAGDGSFITKWGSAGQGNGQFHTPIGVAVDAAGAVYVADLGNSRVQKFAIDGAFLTTFRSGGRLGGWPLFLAVDRAGNVYVTDSLNNQVQKFRPVGVG